MNKKAEHLPAETIIFIVLNVFFIAALLVFVVRTTSGDASVEEEYAKMIDLAIDNLAPGAEIRISVPYLFERAEKNGINGEPIFIDAGKNLVRVKLTKTGGYEFHYFTEIKKARLDTERKILIIKA